MLWQVLYTGKEPKKGIEVYLCVSQVFWISRDKKLTSKFSSRMREILDFSCLYRVDGKAVSLIETHKPTFQAIASNN